MQDSRQEMNPVLRVGVGHPTAWSLHCLNGMLLHRGQHAELVVGCGGQRALLRGAIAPAGAGLPITGAVLPRGDQRLRDMGRQRLPCRFRQAGQRAPTPGAPGDLLIP